MLHKRFEELKLSGHLPSPSGIGLAILHQTQSDTAGIDELVRILQTDPALTGRILKLANSRHQGGAEPAKTVTQAAVRLGPRAVRSVALGFTLVSSNRAGSCSRFDYDHYWSFSLASAVAAQALARRLGVCDPSEAFTCGLLSRVGMLALACVHPDAYAQILAESSGDDDARLLAAETRDFEINNREVTASMMAECGLPRAFTAAIPILSPAGEGSADDDEASLPMRRLVLSANRIAALLLRDLDLVKTDPSRTAREIEMVHEGLPFDVDEVLLLCEQVNREWRGWSELFRIPVLCESGGASMHRHATGQRAGTAAAGLDPHATRASRPAPGKQPLEVLVVGEDERFLRLISLYLRSAGYQVRTAANGRAGLETALAEAPGIIVADSLMPEMSGIELCRNLRAIESGRRTYVLILTERDDQEQVVEAFGAGADDYVTKPCDLRILLARVQAGHRLVQLQSQVEAGNHDRTRRVREVGLATHRLRTAGVTDVLAELPDRSEAQRRLTQEWSAAVALGRPLSLVMIDVDDLKKVNDAHGREVGDVVLEETARVLRALTRRGDVVSRLGGGEFLVVNLNCDLRAALVCAERLRSSVEAHRIVHAGFDGHVTISLGVVERSAAIRDVDEFLRAADRAVDQAKAAGRNRIHRAGPPTGLPRTA